MLIRQLQPHQEINMAEIRSGIFSLNEFNNRTPLKLAPDGFVVINGALGAKVITPNSFYGDTRNLSMRGGITSISINAAVSPPGASKATIEVVAPQYKGLHEDYYITLPTGVKIPYFCPMMEVKIFMKGRFLDAADGYKTKYYPVFWGLITDITENYSDGNFTFSITCSDMLTWWKWQKLTLRPAILSEMFGAPQLSKFPTILQNLNPWEIIVALFTKTAFMSDDGKTTYNMVYQHLSKYKYRPDYESKSNDDVTSLLGSFALDINQYWANRFGFNLDLSKNPDKQGERIPLEMYGLSKPIQWENIFSTINSIPTEADASFEERVKSKLTLDFNMISRCMPFAAFSNWGDGAEPLEMTKLEIANEVCEQSQMEFFVDTNGTFVFKPPFYNMDVVNTNLPIYVIDTNEVINMSTSIDSNSIVTYLEGTSPQIPMLPEMELNGFHIDYDLMKRFGVRYQTVAFRYGNSAKTLRLLTAAEMAKINGRAFTGSVSIPLRPELRLGYPVYIRHIDAYYYVTGITHNITFGTSATTDLSLEFRRDRVFDPDGTVAIEDLVDINGQFAGQSYPGKVVKGYVYRFDESTNVNSLKNLPKDPVSSIETQINQMQKNQNVTNGDVNSIQQANSDANKIKNDILKDNLLRVSNLVSGPKTTGFYKVSKAAINVVPGQSPTDGYLDYGTPDAIVSNELLMMTDDTIPYTDINGYRHIGAFPYGANLKICKKGLIDTSDTRQKTDADVDTLISARPTKVLTENFNRTDDGETIYQFGYTDGIIPERTPVEEGIIQQNQQTIQKQENTPGPDNVKMAPDPNNPLLNPRISILRVDDNTVKQMMTAAPSDYNSNLSNSSELKIIR
jgi:hypothetical protein